MKITGYPDDINIATEVLPTLCLLTFPLRRGVLNLKKYFFYVNGRDELFWGYFQKSNGYVFEFVGSFCAHPMVGSLCVPTPDCW